MISWTFLSVSETGECRFLPLIFVGKQNFKEIAHLIHIYLFISFFIYSFVQ
jgi:hypothetical protein